MSRGTHVDPELLHAVAGQTGITHFVTSTDLYRTRRGRALCGRLVYAVTIYAATPSLFLVLPNHTHQTGVCRSCLRSLEK